MAWMETVAMIAIARTTMSHAFQFLLLVFLFLRKNVNKREPLIVRLETSVFISRSESTLLSVVSISLIGKPVGISCERLVSSVQLEEAIPPTCKPMFLTVDAMERIPEDTALMRLVPSATTSDRRVKINDRCKVIIFQ